MKLGQSRSFELKLSQTSFHCSSSSDRTSDPNPTGSAAPHQPCASWIVRLVIDGRDLVGRSDCPIVPITVDHPIRDRRFSSPLLWRHWQPGPAGLFFFPRGRGHLASAAWLPRTRIRQRLYPRFGRTRLAFLPRRIAAASPVFSPSLSHFSSPLAISLAHAMVSSSLRHRPTTLHHSPLSPAPSSLSLPFLAFFHLPLLFHQRQAPKEPPSRRAASKCPGRSGEARRHPTASRAP